MNKLLVAVNAEKIYNADQELKEVINQNIGYPDGVGAVWALKQKGINDVTKIPGVELWLEIVRQHHIDKKFYFIGAKEEVIQGAVSKLKREFPGVQVVGFRNGYLKDGDQEILIQNIEATRPDYVFVAMGSPTQERLMIAMSQRFPAVYLGLGGSFDIYSGKTKRAPEIFIRYKLEWLYRLLAEPKRAARQIKLVDFAWKMINKKY
ncbi:WecB/TagA/CpsF family glycosyltransferase [Algoriphagus litoralis]|uniref:WecB/TagA/CpsF family glycosyltransferase n=1 Tax=Algoriphagus litoralis TaxID=2202829 RepID=UPI0018E51B46|nr:WecB/TagA/CpsF family glycosyltransferase [Algoriphagus litoralis]